MCVQNGGCCAMVMPKSGGTPAACGKTNVAVYPYNGAAADTFQQMAVPMNGQYPVASKFLR